MCFTVNFAKDLRTLVFYRTHTTASVNCYFLLTYGIDHVRKI